ncbi:MAG: AAA family ATPase [Myxococcota bacterium]
MNINLVTHHTTLAESVASVLREAGHEVSVRPETVFDAEIRYAPSTALSEVSRLVELLKPLLPAVQPDESLADEVVEVHLGEAKPFSSWEVKVHVESEMLGDRLRTRVQSLGFRDDGLEIEEPERSFVKYGGATPFARQVVRWLLAQEGIVATESKDWGDDDDDIWIYARDPAFEGKTVRERYPVEIHGDDYERMFVLKGQLEAQGFEQVAVRSLDDADRPRFATALGPFMKDPASAAALNDVLKAFLESQGIDSARFPLVEDTASAARGHARIDLPIGAMAGGTLRPYDGAFPERWDVVLRTDDPVAVADLQRRLQEKGFTHISVESLPASAFGFSVRWGSLASYPEVSDGLKAEVQSLMAEREVRSDYTLSASDGLGAEDARVIIDLPFSAAARLSFSDRVREAATHWELTLKCPRPEEYDRLRTALGELPWKAFTSENETDARPEIQYGGAPVQLVEMVRDLVAEHTGVSLPLSKDWSERDDDIWIHLPSSAQTTVSEEEAPIDLSSWLMQDVEAEASAPLVDVAADRVRIGPITLRRQENHDATMVPSPDPFAHYCLDQRTAETLLHVAESVILREPCLLEGETSVSKTSIIQYLAMLLGQPLVRLNLNGQTDTGELVGRYVPQDMAAALPVDPAELQAAADLLESESRMILQRAAEESRNLTRVEVQQIMANERMTVHPWRWQDGLIVTAMKRGWWVVLDELNLAEPQILERLNPVLERHPMLVLSEHDNTVIGSRDVPVHPAFRIFATMNPAEYAGRSPLSPAYRDRWRGYRHVQPPGEGEYVAMLRFLVTGQQPNVVLGGNRYQGVLQAPPMPQLGEIENIDHFLRALARFHSALEEAVGRKPGGGSQLGARRRERYVFSRRGLLAVMDYLASTLNPDDKSVVAMRKALTRYYLGRVQAGTDQRVVARLLDAAGIGPQTWAPERLDALNAGATDDGDIDGDGEVDA